jgi:hypothetical protein
MIQGMQTSSNPKEVVLSYIKALDAHDYDVAADYLSERVTILGPSGESFSKPSEFIGMLKQYQGKYDMKKVFVDGNDVCLLYDFKGASAKAIMCSWYKVDGNKISWIQTIFDPSPFGPARQ